MKNLAKLIVISVFGLGLLVIFLSSSLVSGDSIVTAEKRPNATPTVAPKANTATTAAPAMTATPAKADPPKPAATGGDDSGKKIPAKFTLAQDSLSEYGEVAFDHDSHAFKNYSPDGKSPITCVECHHTDQAKAELKAPLVTSERDVTMTFATWKASSQKVQTCRACHFQDGNVPDGKTMPTKGSKELNNQLAYHINCNDCHDAAFKARPELKGRPGFATSSDCSTCHKKG